MDCIIISLGGSLIVPEEIDVLFLRKFRQLILKHASRGKRFVIICGGGRLARDYQQAASSIVDLKRDDLDWIGIHSTRLNAHLLRTIFRDIAHPNIIKDPTKEFMFKEKVLIAAGWKPGFSTDYDAVLLAKALKAKVIINLSNIDYVCDKDPKKYRDAKPLKKIPWKDFRKMVGDKWDPGMNLPFDPVASKEAEDLDFTVVIMNGLNLGNLNSFLESKEFKGTTITNAK